MYKIFVVLFCLTTSITNGYEISSNTVEFDEKNQSVIASGSVNTNIDQYEISADNFIYNLKEKKIDLDGKITIKDSILDSIYQSDSVSLNLSKEEIIIKNAFGNVKNAKIAAKSIKYNQKLYEGEFITTSLCNTCKNGKKVTPFWKIRAEKLKADILSGDEAKLYNVYFDIFDKQLVYVPFFSLPTMWSGGKTGFLMPNIQNKGVGYQLDIPFYFKASKDLDFTFYPAIGQNSIYGLNMRYRVENCGYEAAIFTGSLPFINNNSIFKAWPVDVKLNSNLFYPHKNEKCKTYQTGSELGVKGQFSLGPNANLLYKYDITDKKILVGDIYGNTTYNRAFASINILNLNNLQLNTQTISLPKVNIYNIKKLELYNEFLPIDQVIMTHISTNNTYNAYFKNRLSDAMGEVRLMTKHYLGANNKLTYAAQLTGYKSTHNNPLYNHQNQQMNTTLDIHYQSKIRHNRHLFEPHLVLHLQPARESFFAIDQGQINDDDDTLSIYSTTNNIHPYNIFSSRIYTTGTRSIMEKNGNHIDYGGIFSTYNKDLPTINKFYVILGGRQYLTQQSKFGNVETYNQDLSLAMIRDTFKEKYVSQLTVERKSFSLTNKTWLTEDLQLLSNEFYLDKNFNKLSTSIQYLFLNAKYNFNENLNQSKFERFLKLKAKYNFNENWSIGGKNTIKFGQDSQGQNITKPGSLKGKIQYENECIQIGLTVKKEFNGGGKKANDNVSSYNLYVKIPSI